MKNKKTRRKQRGGNEILKRQKISESFLILKKQIIEHLFETDPESIPLYKNDDKNYSNLKYTIVKANSHFKFRSKEKLEELKDRGKPTWVDYSASLGQQSFLEPGIFHAKGMAKYKGDWLNTIEVIDNLKIIHFPIEYNSLEAPININLSIPLTKNNYKKYSFTSEFEGLLKKACMSNENKFCADGYTLDFFYSVLQKGKILPAETDYREMCILRANKDTIKLVSSVYMPID